MKSFMVRNAAWRTDLGIHSAETARGALDEAARAEFYLDFEDMAEVQGLSLGDYDVWELVHADVEEKPDDGGAGHDLVKMLAGLRGMAAATSNGDGEIRVTSSFEDQALTDAIRLIEGIRDRRQHIAPVGRGEADAGRADAAVGLKWFLAAAEKDEGGESERRASFAVIGVSSEDVERWQAWRAWMQRGDGARNVEGYSLNVRWIESELAEQIIYAGATVLEDVEQGEWLALCDTDWVGFEILDGAIGLVGTDLDRVRVSESGDLDIFAREDRNDWAICTPLVGLDQLERWCGREAVAA